MKIAINKTKTTRPSTWCFDIVVIECVILSKWPRQYGVYRDWNHIENLDGTMVINWRAVV